VYGLGATLFAALTGHAAYERRDGEQLVAQFLRIASESAPNLRESGIPDDISAVIENAMARSPDNRPSTAELGEQLQRLQERHQFPARITVRHRRHARLTVCPVGGDPSLYCPLIHVEFAGLGEVFLAHRHFG
jgi:serine/threonine protein kinase